jgi:PPOX class probable F420-dependent enzyme
VDRVQFLAEPRVAALATLEPDGLPYQAAVWFEFRDGAFLVPTGRGSRKARNALARPRGSILVDDRGEGFCGLSARGTIEVVEGDEALALNDRIHRRFVTDAGMAEPALGGLLEAGDDVTLRLLPERWAEWDMGPAFGGRLADPRFTRPLAP